MAKAILPQNSRMKHLTLNQELERGTKTEKALTGGS
jgi:hypothetical protein